MADERLADRLSDLFKAFESLSLNKLNESSLALLRFSVGLLLLARLPCVKQAFDYTYVSALGAFGE